MMSAANKQNKRKNKKKYYLSAKKHKTGTLEAGLRGFLITCNDEYQCVKESYNLLNEFADNLFGPEFEGSSTKCAESENMDIEEQLAKEIENIKSKKRRFQQVRTMVKGIIFIDTTVPDPIQLVTSIFENVLKTRQRKTRYILKIIPIVITCKAFQSDIRKSLDEFLEQFVKNEPDSKLSYKTDAKIRHNTNITSSHIIWYVRESVEKCAPTWTVAMVEPDVVFSVYVLKSICCIGVLKNFSTYKKYNISEIVTASKNEEQSRNSTEDLINSVVETNTKIVKESNMLSSESENPKARESPKPTNLRNENHSNVDDSEMNNVPLDGSET